MEIKSKYASAVIIKSMLRGIPEDIHRYVIDRGELTNYGLFRLKSYIINRSIHSSINKLNNYIMGKKEIYKSAAVAKMCGVSRQRLQQLREAASSRYPNLALIQNEDYCIIGTRYYYYKSAVSKIIARQKLYGEKGERVRERQSI